MSSTPRSTFSALARAGPGGTNSPRATKERILIVSDEVVCCETIPSMLTPAGYPCRAAADGVDALDVLNSVDEFELLLTNLRLPGWMGSGCWNERRNVFLKGQLWLAERYPLGRWKGERKITPCDEPHI